MTQRRIEYMDIDLLEPAPRNPKAHDNERTAGSIETFGMLETIVLDERTGKILHGHGRHDNLRRLRDGGKPAPDGIVATREGKWKAPVLRGWSSESDNQALAAAVALNRIGEGLWDLSETVSVLDDLRSEDFNLDGLGFTETDLDRMRAISMLADDDTDTSGTEHAADERLRPPAPEDAITQPGDVWILGDHRLICGDCRDPETVARVLDGRTINMAVTSPPYAEQREYDASSGFKPIRPDEYVEWFAPVAANIAAHLAEDGSWLVNIKPPGHGLDTDLYVFDLVIAHVREWGWHFGTEYCWERNGVPKNVTARFKNQFEPVYQFARGRWKMRPENVRVASMHSVTPFGPGVGNTSWKDAQGDGGVLPHQRTSPRYDGDGQGGAPANGAAEVGRRSQLNSLQFAGDTTRKRPGGRRDSEGEGIQGTAGTYGPGELIGPGMAYPGNRLPTFTGSHEAVGHAAAYPVGLPAWFVKAYTDPGDVVYDPFGGSGSTLLAAAQEGRQGVMVELSAAYCDLICARFETRTGVRAVRESDGFSPAFVKVPEEISETG